MTKFCVQQDETMGNYDEFDSSSEKINSEGISEIDHSVVENNAEIQQGITESTEEAALRSDYSVEGEHYDDALVQVHQPLAGAVNRTQHDKNEEIVSVLDFGADPTGKKDSTSAFQAAIDAVYARGGGEVYIPPTNGDGSGENVGYLISDSVQVKPFVNLRGDGFSSCLRATRALPNGLLQLCYHGGIGGRYISNIRLTGNGSGVGIGTNVDNESVSYQHIYGWTFTAIVVEVFEIGYQFQGLWHSTISNCTSSYCRIGLHLWGQNVSLQISGCHFRRDGHSVDGTYGIFIEPRVYAWSTDKKKGSRSEAINIGQETMCIGVQYGLFVMDCLDLQIGIIDFDYILKAGIVILNVEGGFNIAGGWIAADSEGKQQVIGVSMPASAGTQQQKTINGLHFSLENRNPDGNNIGVSIGSQLAAYASIKNCTFTSGWAGVAIFDNTAGINIDKCIFTSIIYLRNSANVKISNCTLNGLIDDQKAGHNFYYANTGIPSTHGYLDVNLSAGASSGSAIIPYASVSGLKYGVMILHTDISDKSDEVYREGNTITVIRPTPVGVQTSTLVEYRAV
ncbi:glycosyl hydrolase family 28-related protein [Leclercia adecarboxylata]|uniref:glycosyl hydrolase family 28-related protein n=1 Tax=Leclercia adecarboxylata TaxID=83655 RepID=UPI00384EECFD